MKKLLSLLSAITITSSGIAGIVGNAPTQTKNEINQNLTNSVLSRLSVRNTASTSGDLYNLTVSLSN